MKERIIRTIFFQSLIHLWEMQGTKSRKQAVIHYDYALPYYLELTYSSWEVLFIGGIARPRPTFTYREWGRRPHVEIAFAGIGFTRIVFLEGALPTEKIASFRHLIDSTWAGQGTVRIFNACPILFRVLIIWPGVSFTNN